MSFIKQGDNQPITHIIIGTPDDEETKKKLAAIRRQTKKTQSDGNNTELNTESTK